MTVKSSTILEIISAVAVVLSLVFVGFEIRNSSEQVEQNTQALQIAAYQDLIGRIVEINAISIAEGQSIESIISLKLPSSKGHQKLHNHLWILFRHGDMAYFQFEKRAISEERLESVMAPVTARLQYPQVVSWWKERQNAFVPAYRAYINRQIQKINVQEPII